MDLFSVIQSIHLVGIALLVGTIVLDDLQTLGLDIQGIDRLAPATWIGLAIILVTGPILFAFDVSRYLSNPAFLVKMGFLALALASQFTIHRKQTRPRAVLSMVLWTCVVIGGRAIADFDA